MWSKKLSAVVAVCALPALLSACKAEMGMDMNLSDLQVSQVAEKTATLRLEVLSCSDYEDSRNPSDSVIKAQQRVPQVLPGAEYVECYSEQMNSWAQFKIPLAIVPEGQQLPDDSISVISDAGKSLTVHLPERISQGIEDVSNEAFVSDIDPKVFIRLKNDTDEAIGYRVRASWIDDTPAPLGNFNFEPGKEIQIRLSDVSTATAMARQSVRVLYP